LRLRATVAYDGTDFHGFQRQTNVRSVQAVLEEALSDTCGCLISVVGAGRTDAGVHATGQVVAFEAQWAHTLIDMQNALNARLPMDVAILALAECEASFHPRYSALSRTYEYTIAIRPTRQPLLRRTAWLVRTELDMARMNLAAQRLIGEYDFAAFGSPPQGEVTVRRVLQAEWRVITESDVLRFTIEANAFLYKMVRHIVMALVLTGRGALSVDDISDVLTSKDSQRIKGVAPACGLCLVSVTY
jgi:tRNA pseudouridine38-40 synthase